MGTINVKGLVKEADVKKEITNMIKNGSCQVSVDGQVVQKPVFDWINVVSLAPISSSDDDDNKFVIPTFMFNANR